jgi:hypothetical protein
MLPIIPEPFLVRITEISIRLGEQEETLERPA